VGVAQRCQPRRASAALPGLTRSARRRDATPGTCEHHERLRHEQIPRTVTRRPGTDPTPATLLRRQKMRAPNGRGSPTCIPWSCRRARCSGALKPWPTAASPPTVACSDVLAGYARI